MNIQRIAPIQEDDRGAITDLLSGQPLSHVGVISCRKGSLRGNHYHKTATAWVYVLYGRFKYAWRPSRGKKSSQIVEAGDLITIEPGERHSLVALEGSTFIMMVSTPGGGSHYAEGETVAEYV